MILESLTPEYTYRPLTLPGNFSQPAQLATKTMQKSERIATTEKAVVWSRLSWADFAPR